MIFLFFGVAIGVLAIVLNGYTISYLWSWFIVPVFGLPVLSPAQAIGIGLVVVYLTQRIDRDDLKDKSDEETTTRLVQSFLIAILRPAFALLFGKVVCQFL